MTQTEAASRSNGKPSDLPRLGSEDAPKADPVVEEVEIPDRGVSVLLKKPSVETIIEMQGRDTDEDDAEQSFSTTVALVAQMLVEPEWDEPTLRAEVQAWSMTDWLVLQDAAVRLSGTGEEIQRAAQEEFRGADD